jgi:alkylation response protein AidB-like acyl-CoA dehydrogenase
VAAWPTLKEVRSLLRLQPDAEQDGLIQTALAAAIDYGNRRTNYKYPPTADDPQLPDVIHEACLIHASRLYRRRDSIDGTLGFGDAGLIRVGRYDPDIEAAYSAVGPVVFG